MNIDPDLMYAILAMDSYNRGYDPGIANLGGAETKIGNATVKQDSSILRDDNGDRTDQAAGFYASSYQLGSELVISYRGTDDFSADIINGWVAGAGFWQGDQVRLAAEFQKAIKATTPGVASLTYTGHSLGGGLAGMMNSINEVGSIIDERAVIFDNMPFELTSDNIFYYANLTDEEIETLAENARPQNYPNTAFAQEVVDAAFEELTAKRAYSRETFYNSQEPWVIDRGNIDGYFVEGEVLQGARFTGGQTTQVMGLYSHGGPRDIFFQLHNMALLVNLKFAELEGHVDWQTIGTDLWDATFSDYVGQNAGFSDENSGGKSSQSGKMFDAIAYSAINEGELVFGDSAIRSMFNDANELGKVYSFESHDPFLDKTLSGFGPNITSFTIDEALADMLVQYAGALAFNKVEQSKLIDLFGPDFDPASGILEVADDVKTFGLDLSNILWGDALKTGSYPADAEALDIVHKDFFLNAYFLQAKELQSNFTWFWQSEEANTHLLDQLAVEHWNAEDRRIFDRVHMRIQPVVTNFHLSERAYKDYDPYKTGTGSNAHVDLYIGTDQDETLYGTSGHDLIIGGGGKDKFIGGTGKNLIYQGGQAYRDTTTFDSFSISVPPAADGSTGDDGSGSDPDVVGSIPGGSGAAGSSSGGSGTGGSGAVGTASSENGPEGKQTDGYDDLYVGVEESQGLLQQFFNWLEVADKEKASKLVYTVTDVMGTQNNGVPTHELIADKGLEIVGLNVNPLGDKNAIELSYKDLNDGVIEIDRIINIDIVTLSERRDEFRVSNAALQAPIWIDMGNALGGAQESLTKDKYDFLSYESISHGITTVNGASRAGQPNTSLDELSYLEHIKLLAEIILDVPATITTLTSAFKDNDPLRVSGAEEIKLTNHDDTLWYGHLGKIGSAVTGFTGDDEYSKFGVIDGGAGNDVLVFRNPEYIFQGDKVHPEEEHSAVAGQDLNLELIGGAGDDRLVVLGGQGAVAVGGEGRDLIFNSSEKGQLYGDSIDGTGSSDSDVFWYWPGSFIMDAEPNDLLQIFGIPLLGGTNSILGFVGVGNGGMAIDWLLPFMFYGLTDSNQLLVINALALNKDEGALSGAMIVEDYDFGGFKDDSNFAVPEAGDLGMTFRIHNSPDAKEISLWQSVWGHLITFIDVLFNLTKAIRWQPVDDPLVLDLDGDGIETISQSQSDVHFDLDGDYFAEQTGWLSADDGFLVIDRNGNGRIDDITEMFGAPDVSAYDELAALDDNDDGFITLDDSAFDQLRVWRDLDQDGLTDDGELATLSDHDITSIAVAGEELNSETPQGTTLRASGAFTRSDGSTGNSYEAIFETNSTDTIYRGDNGIAEWLRDADDVVPNAKGFGAMANLGIDISNDFELSDIVLSSAASMTTADLRDLRDKATPVFGAWSQSLELTRELTPVLLNKAVDGTTLVDRAIYTEDASGGYWVLDSGNPILDGDSNAITRATLEDVMNQAITGDQIWQLEQMFSPQSRGAALEHRDNSPYLVTIVEGRPVIQDYAIQNGDGSWHLASGADVTDADGNVIAAPTVEDITAMATADGTEWRLEELGFNPYINIPVDQMGVQLIDGIVSDYTV